MRRRGFTPRSRARQSRTSAGAPREAAPVAPGEPPVASSDRLLSIRPLKEFARTRIPANHPLREVILAERDFLTPVEFLAKLEVWQVLANYRT